MSYPTGRIFCLDPSPGIVYQYNMRSASTTDSRLALSLALCEGDEDVRVTINRDELARPGPARARVVVRGRDGAEHEMLVDLEPVARA